MNTGKLLSLAVASAVILTGCAKAPQPEPKPFTPNPVYLERCYVMDVAAREAAGRANIAEGVQFYFQLECDNNIAMPGYTQAAETVEPTVIVADKLVEQAAPTSVNTVVEKTEANTIKKKEPTCIFDKMTAGRGDLPPCPLDDENPSWMK